jgi:anion-transporting  ArsA/GET3 family ATPase
MTQHSASSGEATPPRAPPRSLSQALLVLGKGGVGKTTIAAGLAALEAQTHGAAIFVEFGDGDAGKRALAGAGRAVRHVVIRPIDAAQRAAAPLFGSATVAKIVLGNFAIKPLLAVAPAIRELAMLEVVRQLAADNPGVRVIVDMPATGHSVAWLRVPTQGRDFLGSGPLFELCDRIRRDLLSPGRASIIVVSLPERLVIEETLELCAAVARETSLAVDRIAVNRVPVALPREALTDAHALAAAGGPLAGAAAELAVVLESREAQRAEAVAALDSLAGKEHTVWHLPLAPGDPSARDVARWLLAEGAP